MSTVTFSPRQLMQLHEQVVKLLPGHTIEGARPEGGFTSFQIGGALPLDLDLKQRLLTSHSEAERVGILNEYLEKLLPRLRLAAKVERSSRGNGKGR